MIPIKSYVVAPDKQIECLAEYFGCWAPDAENYLSKIICKLCKGQQVMDWQLYKLSNGGFYLTPLCEDKIQVFAVGHDHHAFLSADALGIITSLYTINTVYSHSKASAKKMLRYSKLLLDYLEMHSEAALMNAIIHC